MVNSIVMTAARAGRLEPTVSFYPWARAEKMIETGEVFAAFPYVEIAANDQEQLIRALIIGRIDYFIADPHVVNDSLKKLFPNELAKFRSLKKPLKDSRKTGSLAGILAKYKPEE
jgi:ABC-type amino acid transport substrate-binding protein